MNGNALLTPHLWLYLQKSFPAGHWSFLGFGSETKWYSTYNERPRGEWDRVAELMMIKFGGSGHPVFRATSPLSRGTFKSKGSGKLSIYFCADGETIETVFRTIVSVHQLSIFGAVSDLCEEYTACQVRTGSRTIWPIVWASKFVDENTFSFDQWSWRSIAKVPRTSGLALTTKSCDENLNWCRIPGNSWSRTVLHDTGHWRYLLLRADQRLKKDHEDVLLPAHLEELYLSVKDLGIIFSRKLVRLSLTQRQNDWVLFFVMVIYLEKMMERLNSEDQKIIFGTILCILNIGLMKSGRAQWQKGGGNKKRFQYCTDPSGQEMLYIWALQGHSGRNPIDPSLQDNVLIPNDFFEYTYHVGCAISLHSIMNSGLIPGGRNLSNRQTVFFLPVDPMDKEHKDPDVIDLEAPRLAWYKQKTWKKHQNTMYWVDINLALTKRFKFCQTRSNAIILYDTLPAYCVPKGIMMGSGEVIYEKVYASPRPPPKISF